MQVKCPNCGFSGNIADKLVPEEGRNVSCPKCREPASSLSERCFPRRKRWRNNPLPSPKVRAFPGDNIQAEAPHKESGPQEVGNRYKDPKYFFTQLVAVLSGALCVGAGIYLAMAKHASGEGNIMFTICNGMGYYFIAKGFFIGFSLWNMAKMRENQGKKGVTATRYSGPADYLHAIFSAVV